MIGIAYEFVSADEACRETSPTSEMATVNMYKYTHCEDTAFDGRLLHLYG